MQSLFTTKDTKGTRRDRRERASQVVAASDFRARARIAVTALFSPPELFTSCSFVSFVVDAVRVASLRSEKPAVLRLVSAARDRQAWSAVAHLFVRHAQSRFCDGRQRGTERCEQALSRRLSERNRLHRRGGLIFEPRPDITEQALALRDTPSGASETERGGKPLIVEPPQRHELPLVEFGHYEQERPQRVAHLQCLGAELR